MCRQLYYAFIYSRISYGIQIYGNCSNHLLGKLQTIQNKLLKFLLKLDPETGTDLLHKTMRILKLKDLYKVSILNFVNNCIQGRNPEIFINYFTIRPSNNNRNTNQLIVPFRRINVGCASIKHRGAHTWNSLSECCLHKQLYKT